ncbi:MAG: cell division protein SepF [Lachnospiraceae bacterium]|nr:cell division protein SepF [Lachnospiraceae bacterium]
MSLFDKIAGMVGVRDDYDDDYDDDYVDEDEAEEDEEEEEVSSRKRFVNRSSSQGSVKNNITPMRKVKGKSSTGREIIMFKPTPNEDTICDIMDALKTDKSVVLNLENANSVSETYAQKVIDTISGCCYTLDGNMLKISDYIFIVAPKTVGLNGDGQAFLMDSLELPAASGMVGRR